MPKGGRQYVGRLMRYGFPVFRNLSQQSDIQLVAPGSTGSASIVTTDPAHVTAG